MVFGDVHDLLLAAHGPQRWWPAESRFEIIAGALLVQRTTWRSAEKALAALQGRRMLDPVTLAAARAADIESCIRVAGFYRSKAARLKKLSQFVVDCGGTDALADEGTDRLRERLLRLDGIGAETADAILLYAFARPVLVIDAYLRRFAQRLAGVGAAIADDEIAAWILAEIDSVPKLNELHALVVAHGKSHCRKQPRCDDCGVRALCRSARP
jgi:endonuclease-3 related protein